MIRSQDDNSYSLWHIYQAVVDHGCVPGAEARPYLSLPPWAVLSTSPSVFPGTETAAFKHMYRPYLFPPSNLRTYL